MGPETVVTLVLVAVLVAVLAVYILAIGFALRRLSFTLGTIVIGLRAIAQQTAPVGAVVGDLIGEVDVIEDALEGLVGAVVAAKKAPKAPKAPTSAAPRPSGTRPPEAVAWKPQAGEPAAGAESADDWDDLVVTGTLDHAPPPGAAAIGGGIPARGRGSKARSSGRGGRSASRSKKRANAPMSDAVARARQKVGGPSGG